MPVSSKATEAPRDPARETDLIAAELKKARMDNQRLLSNAYYKHLHRRLVMIVVLVSFAPMIVAIGVILDQFRISYREKIHAHLEELVLKHKQGIDTFLTEKLGDIRFVADAFNCDQLSDPVFLKDMLITLQQEYGGVFEDLGLVDGSGRQVAYAGPYLLTEADYSEADWFRKAIEAPYFISDVFLGLRGTPHFIVAVRKDFEGSSCLLRATINFAAFNTLVENLRVGKTGFAYILNRDLEFQTKPLYEISLSKDGYFANFLKKGAGASRPAHIVERDDRRGVPSIFATAFLKDNQWLLVFQQSTEDAFSDISRTVNIAILIFIAGAIAIVAMAHILSGRMVGAHRGCRPRKGDDEPAGDRNRQTGLRRRAGRRHRPRDQQPGGHHGGGGRLDRGSAGGRRLRAQTENMEEFERALNRSTPRASAARKSPTSC